MKPYVIENLIQMEKFDEYRVQEEIPNETGEKVLDEVNEGGLEKAIAETPIAEINIKIFEEIKEPEFEKAEDEYSEKFSQEEINQMFDATCKRIP